MPESLDNPNALTMRKILDLDPNDPRVLKVMADAKGDAKRFHEEYVVPLNKRIAKAFPWFSGTDSDWTKIEALLSLKLAKPFNWFGDTLSAEQYLAVVDASAIHEQSQQKTVKPPKPSRVKPDSEVTKWVRKNWQKYRYNKASSVRHFIELKGLPERQYDSLYSQLNNDHRKNPLQKPKKS